MLVYQRVTIVVEVISQVVELIATVIPLSPCRPKCTPFFFAHPFGKGDQQLPMTKM